MEADKPGKSTRKRGRLTGSDANNTNESALSDDGNKHYSIRSRRTQTKPIADDATSIQSSSEKVGPSPSASPANPVTNADNEQNSAKNSTAVSPQTASPIPSSQTASPVISQTASPVISQTASPALQQATRELHARIMSRVRDLAPSFTSGKPSVTVPITPNPRTDPTPTAIQSTPSSTNTTATKNTTRTVKELQHLISQYVQQQRANLGIATPNSVPISPTSNPTSCNTNSRIVHVPTVTNPQRSSTDISNQQGVSSDNNFQKSSIIANKFSNAITKYARSPTTSNSSVAVGNMSNFVSHPPASGSHFTANNKPLQQAIVAGHEAGPSVARTVTSFTRPVSSILDKSVPALSIQYKHTQKEKRQKTEYGYYDDISSNSSDGNGNYFLLAAQHELQNMAEEMATLERLELMEHEIDHLQRGIAMRDRVIGKLRDEIEEKDAVSHSK